MAVFMVAWYSAASSYDTSGVVSSQFRLIQDVGSLLFFRPVVSPVDERRQRLLDGGNLKFSLPVQRYVCPCACIFFWVHLLHAADSRYIACRGPHHTTHVLISTMISTLHGEPSCCQQAATKTGNRFHI
jgi:hypothetical protein